MQEISFWRHCCRLLIAGLIVILLLPTSDTIHVEHAQTQRFPQGQNCGTIFISGAWRLQKTYGIAQLGGTTRQVEQCFIQAYHSCQKASIGEQLMQVDTSQQYILTIVSQKGDAQCQIISSSKFQGVTGNTDRTNACQGLTLTTDLLVVKRCGNSDVTIPRGEYCGWVFPGDKNGMNLLTEDCFMQNQQQCYPTAMTTPSGVFEIDISCNITRIADNSSGIDTPDVTCRDMIQQMDGLHFHGCGSNDEILVPVNP